MADEKKPEEAEDLLKQKLREMREESVKRNMEKQRVAKEMKVKEREARVEERKTRRKESNNENDQIAEKDDHPTSTKKKRQSRTTASKVPPTHPKIKLQTLAKMNPKMNEAPVSTTNDVSNNSNQGPTSNEVDTVSITPSDCAQSLGVESSVPLEVNKKVNSKKKVSKGISHRTKAEQRKYETEKKRKQRERIRNDKDRYEKIKALDRNKKRELAAAGKVKHIGDMNPREQRNQRRIWRDATRKLRAKRRVAEEAQTFATTNSPPESEEDEEFRVPNLQEYKYYHRRKMETARKRHNRQVSELEAKVEHYKKLAARWKAKAARTVEVSLGEPSSGVQPLTPSPNTKALQTIESGREAVKRKLMLGEIIVKGIQRGSSLYRGEIPEPSQEMSPLTFRRVLSNRLLPSTSHIDKYQLKEEVKSIVGQRQVLTSLFNNNPIKQTPKKMSEVREEIRSFLEEDDNSYSTPGKKDWVTLKSVKKQKRYLSGTLKELHKKFNEGRMFKISYALFCRLRPFWIVSRKLHQRDTCLCQKHENVALLFQKCKQLKLLAHATVRKAVLSICCEDVTANDFSCMHRTCDNCKDKTLQFLTDVDLCETDSTFYYKWVRVTEQKSKNGKEVSVKVTKKIKVDCTIALLKEAMTKEIIPFMAHAYRSYHQINFSKTLKKELQNDEVFFIMDFSENYQLKYSSEIQSTHFGASNNQLTLHTGAYYVKKANDYDGSVNDDYEDHVVTFCSVSESMRHDSSSIWAHMMPVLDEVRYKYPDVKKAHFLSDGPTKQYRNRTTMFLLSHFAKVYGFDVVSYNFSEAGHGKSVADGVGGTVKRTVDNQVALGRDVPDIDSFLLSIESLKTKMFKIEEKDIQNVDKVLLLQKLKPIPHVMKLHQLVLQAPNYKTFHLRYVSCVACRSSFHCSHYQQQPPGEFSFDEDGPNETTFQEDEQSNLRVEERPDDFAPATDDFVAKDVLIDDVAINKWVAVIYDDKWYPGQVIEMKEDVLKVTFMHSSGSNFLWPGTQDIQSVHISGVLRLLKPPVKISSRIYKFDDSKTIDELCANVIGN